MFGLGIGELLIVAVVALLFIGPDKLPEAAKSLSKGIRDIRKQTRDIQDTLEDDAEIGDAIRDLKSAFRGDDPPPPRRSQKDKGPLHLPAKAGQEPHRDRNETATAALATSAIGQGSQGSQGSTTAAAPEPAADEAPAQTASDVAFPEPVIRPPGNAIARGSTGSGSTPSPEEAAEPSPTAPEPSPTEKKAHG